MARTVAELPKGTRITDYISLGVVAKTFPWTRCKSVLAETGKPAGVSGNCRRTWWSTT